MSGKNITLSDIVKGALELGAECVVNKRSVHEQMEYSNGCNAAEMDHWIWKTNKKLFWDMRKQRVKIDKNYKSYTLQYIDAYNRKAREYCMPEHHIADSDEKV